MVHGIARTTSHLSLAPKACLDTQQLATSLSRARLSRRPAPIMASSSSKQIGVVLFCCTAITALAFRQACASVVEPMDGGGWSDGGATWYGPAIGAGTDGTYLLCITMHASMIYLYVHTQCMVY